MFKKADKTRRTLVFTLFMLLVNKLDIYFDWFAVFVSDYSM